MAAGAAAAASTVQCRVVLTYPAGVRGVPCDVAPHGSHCSPSVSHWHQQQLQQHSLHPCTSPDQSTAVQDSLIEECTEFKRKHDLIELPHVTAYHVFGGYISQR